jgi:hypothetical protein
MGYQWFMLRRKMGSRCKAKQTAKDYEEITQ